MSEWSFVGLAYGLTWAVLAAYTFYLRSRNRRAEAARAEAAREAGRRT